VSWQLECQDGLRVALDMGGATGEEHWRALRQKWLTQKKDRVILADLDLSGADLRDYDLSRCWVGRSSFINANLSGANLSQSILRDCDLTGANIRGTNFYAADLASPNNRLIHTQFDNATNMEVNRSQLAPEMDRALVDMAEGAWRRTDWQRRRSKSLVYKLLSFITDYGFGFGRIALSAGFTVVAFAVIFCMADPQTTVGGALLISARYFIGLEDHYSASNALLSFIGVGEAVLGLGFLAVVIAVFTSKFTDL
jgi:uncharacterized protein YjbI with pentapeptide repeats